MKIWEDISSLAREHPTYAQNQMERRKRQKVDYAESESEHSESEHSESESEQSESEFHATDADEESESDDVELYVVESEDDDSDSVDEPVDDIVPDEDDNDLYFDEIRKRIQAEHLQYYSGVESIKREDVKRCLRFIRRVGVIPYYEHDAYDNLMVKTICTMLEKHYKTQQLPKFGGIPRAFFKAQVVCHLYARLLYRVKPNMVLDRLESEILKIVERDPVDYIKQCVDCAVIFLVRFEEELPAPLKRFFEVVQGEGNSDPARRNRLVLGAIKKGDNSQPSKDHNRLLIQVLSNDELENERQMHICAHVPKDYELDTLFDFCKQNYDDVNKRLGERHFTLVFSPLDSLFGRHWNHQLDEGSLQIVRNVVQAMYEREGIPPRPEPIRIVGEDRTIDKTCPYYKVPPGFKLDKSASSWDTRGLFCLIENTEGLTLKEDKFYNLKEDDWDNFVKTTRDNFMKEVNQIDSFPKGVDLRVGIRGIKVLKVPVYKDNANKRKEKIDEFIETILPEFKNKYEYLRRRFNNKKVQYLANLTSQKKFYELSSKKLVLMKVQGIHPLRGENIVECELK